MDLHSFKIQFTLKIESWVDRLGNLMRPFEQTDSFVNFDQFTIVHSQVRVEGAQLQSDGCGQLPDDQERIQDERRPPAEESSQCPQQGWQVRHFIGAILLRVNHFDVSPHYTNQLKSVRIRNNLRDRNNLQSCSKKVKNIERGEKWKSIGILMVIVMWYMSFRYLSNLKCQMQQRSTECHTGILEFYCQLPGFYIKFNLSYRKA